MEVSTRIESMMGAFLSELRYFESAYKEHQEIIRQLSGEKLEYEYIHPMDLMELYNRLPANSFIDVYSRPKGSINEGVVEIYDHGTVKKYKQSALIPAKNFKRL